MRKQTKVVAVASAAALLAIGGAMTSFAAQGWVEEDGTWYYYDKDGNRVENEWKKSGDNWFFLDGEEGGAMATDALIEDDDDIYYVDANGVMVTNTWVKVVNEDQDDDDDPAEYRYYYMQSNGKAYKAGDSGKTKFKTIDGKKYAFDEDGKMLYGWVAEDGDMCNGEDEWENATYYFGSWEDGSMKTGWQKISVYDDSTDKEDDFDYWFNFKSNGKKRAHSSDDLNDTWKSNGKYYHFDNRGVMVYEWALASGAAASSSSVSNWQYFNSPEDGARVTKGWFKVVAPDDDNDNTFKDYGVTSFAPGDAEDENERWYYADGEGNLEVGKIKKIKGKYYGFAPAGNKAGSMLTGLCALRVNSSTGEIEKLWARDMDSDDLDDAMQAQGDFATASGDYFGAQPTDTLYYFGSNEDTDGAMKTGSVSVTLDGDSYQFQFSKTGGAEGKGRGLNGIDDGKYVYKFGQKLKAGSDDKYIVVYADGDTGAANVNVHKIDSAALRAMADIAGKNKDGDSISYVGALGYLDANGKLVSNYYLLNSSGTIVKNKTAAKDGNDWYYYVKDKVVRMYTNNNTLTGDDTGVKNLKDNWDKANAPFVNSSISEVNTNAVPSSSLIDDGI